MKSSVQKLFDDLFINYPVLVQCKNEIKSSFTILVDCYRSGGKTLVCGNGGSAADSEHIVGELMKGFRLPRAIPPEDSEKIAAVDADNSELLCKGLQRTLPAISLVSQVSLFSAFVNDISAEMAFAQQVYGYGKENDVLLAISTSGESRNVCRAALVGRALGLKVIGLTGRDSGSLARFCDVIISAPSDRTFRIQEYHQPLYHTLCAMLEEEFFGEEC